MDINFEVADLRTFQELAEKAPGILLKNMRLAMKISCRDVQKDARAKHRFRSRTGILEMAVETSITEDRTKGIEGNVFIDDTKACYGKWVHDGTKSHWIYPRNKKWLRWPSNDGSRFIFAKKVHHPGTVKDQFVYQAAENNRQKINNNFNRYTDRAIREAGL